MVLFLNEVHEAGDLCTYASCCHNKSCSLNYFCVSCALALFGLGDGVGDLRPVQQG